MKKVRIIISLFLILTGYTAIAMANQNEPGSKIKLYTIHDFGAGFETADDISLVINGQLMILKNHPGSAGNSYVEVDRSFNNGEITQAKFTWIYNGKKRQCTAFDLPLYVQEGQYQWGGTIISFDCK
jgi:hypothetical protein